MTPMAPNTHQMAIPWHGITDVSQILAGEPHELKKLGFVRMKSIIPISLNDLIKAEARRLGVNSDRIAGFYLCQGCSDMKRAALQADAAKMKELHGPNWLNMLAEYSE